MKMSEASNTAWMLLLICAGILWFLIRLQWGRLSVPPYGDIPVYLLLAPFAEELFFRGVVQDLLKKRVKGGLYALSYANILASAVFAACHFPFWGYFHSALVFIPSLAFGFMYDRSGRLIYPVILHALYNLNVFIV